MKIAISFALLALAVCSASAAYGDQQTVVRAVPVTYKVSESKAARTIAILRALNEANEDGSFNYNFESEDGIKVEATGSQKQVGAKAEERGTVQRGSYSYTAPDGTPISMTWTADERGFRPEGSHLPVAPPMPDYVVKMLAEMKNNPAPAPAPAPARQPQQQVFSIQQQEVKAAPAPAATQMFVIQQSEEQQAPAQPARQQNYVILSEEPAKAAPPTQTIFIKSEETRAPPAPATQMILIQSEEPAPAPAPVSAPAPQMFVIQQSEEQASAPRQVAYAVTAPAAKTSSSSSRQIFRVTIPAEDGSAY